MEIYPTISTQILDVPVYCFDKLDGSNIRAEWTRKRGLSRFGTRRRLLDETEPVLGESISLIREKYEEELSRIFTKERYEKATAYFEFFGENSFAGNHENEQHHVMLLDVYKYKHGFVAPREFLKTYAEKVDIPALLHHGKANADFIKKVRESILEGMTFEGVICKGGKDKRNNPVMFKVKSWAWLDRLKGYCGDDEQMYETLR